MPACWSYRRTSTARQAGSDRSGIQRQEQALAEWLAAHPDYKLQAALLDAGLSGSGAHRRKGALGAFIAAAQASQVPPGSVLVVESLTRFSRENERQVMGTLLNDFWGNDLGLAICGHDEIYTAELIDSQPHRLHVLLALMQQARAEWLEKSRRSKGARAAERSKQDNGIRTSGRTPFTCLRDDNNKAIKDAAGLFQLDPVGAETVRTMVELFFSGLGGSSIAKALNEQGRPTRGSAKQWSGEEVRKVLNAPFIKGTLQRKAGDVDNYFPAVIDAATYDQIQQLSAQRIFGKTNLKGTATAVNNLFQGACFCSACGSVISHFMAGAASSGNRRYVGCRGAVRLHICNQKTYHSYMPLEATALAMLRQADWSTLLLRPEDQSNLTQLRQEHSAAASQLIEIQRLLTTQQARAEEAWLEAASEERLATIERALARLRQQLADAQARSDQAASHLALAEARPTAPDQARLIQERLVELLPQLDQPEARQRFNRWLRSTQPSIQFKLHPDERLELAVGGASVAISCIDEATARIALSMGGTDLVVGPRGDAVWNAPSDGEWHEQ